VTAGGTAPQASQRFEFIAELCCQGGRVGVNWSRMRGSYLQTLALLLVLSLGCAVRAEVDEPGFQGTRARAAVIICEGLIDDALFKSIKRRTRIALDAGANYLVYEISTYGGLVKAADDISKYFILETNKKAHTVAYVATEAISAGAMVSVSCSEIIMRENTTIGCSAPILLGGQLGKEEREKTESFVRSTFKRAAEANGYPTALLEAMVTMQLEVYRVKNRQTGEYEFFEKARLPKDPNVYDLENKELVVKEGELLTITASKALEYGLASTLVEDRAGVFKFLARRDGVQFVGEPLVLKTLWSEEMVRWLNHPAVMSVLVLLAFLGAYIELNTPGVGLPGLVAVICFAIIIGSKYLVGLANWIEVALFVVGLVLLAVEIFLLPGFGIAGLLGIVCVMAGGFGMLVKNPPGKLPWPETAMDWQLFANGVLGLVLGFTGFLILAWAFSKYLPKLEFLSGLILVPTPPKSGTEFEVEMTAPPESRQTGIKVGDVGQVISKLRPVGRARFGDATVDVVAEGDFLDTGTMVEIIKIRGNKVVVRARNT